MSTDAPVIAIDGPAGVGKTTVACDLARRMNYHILPSGAFYRSAAFLAAQEKIAEHDLESLIACVKTMRLEFVLHDDSFTVRLNGRECGELLYDETWADPASNFATLPGLRAELVAKQRALCRPPGLVAEGRDMGSVIFPDARWKFFLTASVEVRAKRRWKQLNAAGGNVSLGALRRDLAQRDRRDTDRRIAPLVSVPLAVRVDTTFRTVAQTVQRLVALVTTKED